MSSVDANLAAQTPAAGGTPGRWAPGDPLDLVLSHLRELVGADATLLLTVDRDRATIAPIAWWFSSPQLHAAVAPAMERSYDRARPGLTEAALERGRPLLLPRLEDWEAAGHLRELVGAQKTGAWELIRRTSAIACPIRTALGRTLGALVVLSADSRRPLAKADLDIVTVLADLAALALERSDMLAGEHARAREELLLKRAAEGTAGTLEPHEVERRVVEHAIQIASADHGRLSRIQPGSQRLTVVAEAGSAEEVDAATLAEVVRSRAAVARGGGTPALHVPIELGPRLFGVLSLTRVEGPEFDRDDQAVVLKLARIAAAALANAQDFHHERHLARTLTHGFVPESLPTVPGWDVGVLYEPADDQPTGGDLYGAWALPSGEVAVVIGDVVGKGVETAALSAMARFFIEARSWDCPDPALALEQVSALLRSRLPEDRFVTAFLGYLSRRRLRYANAGHLAPLVLRVDGELSAAAAGGLPLGIDDAPGYVEHQLDLGSDDLLVAFTDGLLEARRGGKLLGDQGLQRILVEATRMTRDPQALTELVHDDVRAWASGLSDDAAMLALRRRSLEVVGE
jgi:serine phosphatase RsbU (regulator of sigma subunit)